MAGFKRKRSEPPSGLRKPFSANKKRRYVSVQKQVQQVLDKNIETKRSVHSTTDGNEIVHNTFITLETQVLATSQGVTDPTTTSTFNRIGDEINLKGVSFKIMLELNERYSDVTFRLLLVRAARGDVPTRATLFNGLSTNKMLDTFNSERYTILYSKYVKLTARNYGNNGVDIGLFPIGTVEAGNIPLYHFLTSYLYLQVYTQGQILMFRFNLELPRS